MLERRVVPISVAVIACTAVAAAAQEPPSVQDPAREAAARPPIFELPDVPAARRSAGAAAEEGR